jgi:hypothetical protein
VRAGSVLVVAGGTLAGRGLSLLTPMTVGREVAIATMRR